MALWNDFPYTNFHEQNQDWIIRTIKQLVDDFAKVNGGFEAIEKEFQSFKDFVVSQIQGLDFYPAVSKKIDEMITDGSFEQVLRDVDVKYHLCFERIFRIHEKTGKYTDTPSDIIGCQGIAIDSTGNFYITANSSDSDWSDLGTIYKCDNNGNVILKKTGVAIGHGNWLTFYPEKNVILCCNGYKHMTVFSTELEVVRVVTSESIELSNISYDYLTKKVYNVNGGYLHVMNEQYEFERVHPINTAPFHTQQGFAVNRGYLWSVSFRPNSIARLSLSSGSPIYIDSVDNTVDIFKAGELESVCFDSENNMYLLTCIVQNDKHIYQVFKTNVLFSYRGSTSMMSDSRGTEQPTYNINPSGSATNPTGSPDKPFKSLEDMMCLANIQMSNVVFAPDSNCRDEYVSLKNVSLNVDFKNSIFGGVNVLGCPFSGFDNLKIDNSVITKPLYDKAPVYCLRTGLTRFNALKINLAKSTAFFMQLNNCDIEIVGVNVSTDFTGKATEHTINAYYTNINARDTVVRAINLQGIDNSFGTTSENIDLVSGANSITKLGHDIYFSANKPPVWFATTEDYTTHIGYPVGNIVRFDSEITLTFNDNAGTVTVAGGKKIIRLMLVG